MEVIMDGTGKGYRAQVNEHNQLLVLAETNSEEGERAKDGESFIVHARCHTASAANGAFLYIKNNDPDNVIAITRIYIDPFTLSSNDLIVTQVFDPSLAGGTDVSNSVVIQKNRGSAKLCDLTVRVSDGASDLIIAGGTEYHAFPVTSRTSIQRDMQTTNVIPGGKAVAWGWFRQSGNLATDGEVVSFSVNLIKRAI